MIKQIKNKIKTNKIKTNKIKTNKNNNIKKRKMVFYKRIQEAIEKTINSVETTDTVKPACEIWCHSFSV